MLAIDVKLFPSCMVAASSPFFSPVCRLLADCCPFLHIYIILYLYSLRLLLSSLVSQSAIGLFCSWSNLFIIYFPNVSGFHVVILIDSITTNKSQVNTSYFIPYYLLLINHTFQFSNFIKPGVSEHALLVCFSLTKCFSTSKKS